jgi:phosphatidylserine synthase 2
MWIPPEHFLLKVRLALWAFSAIGATKEYYEYMSNKYCYKFGPFFWLSSMTLLVEFSIIVKFGINLFTAPFPGYVKIIWGVISVFIVIGGIYAYMNGRKSK